MSNTETLLGKLRREFKPRIPSVLNDLNKCKFVIGDKTSSVSNSSQISKLFKNTFGSPIISIENDSSECKNDNNNRLLKVGVVLSGGQASGGQPSGGAAPSQAMPEAGSDFQQVQLTEDDDIPF